ncbi:hypothetical protein ATR01nite_01320 [Acetobacter tropicalis]|uniref:Uncharacterized protein n=1 Tax=Acetobacter tropicalis TaxID=104102 RepID=A0A511FKX3_9PROT|nr:hypothetical protein ATR01nite_01320 [Acetobacter tropicalis]
MRENSTGHSRGEKRKRRRLKDRFSLQKNAVHREYLKIGWHSEVKTPAMLFGFFCSALWV